MLFRSAIFFVPAGVGLMTNFDVLAESWLQLLIIMLVTTAIMMWFVGQVVQKIMKPIKSEDQVELPEEPVKEVKTYD